MRSLPSITLFGVLSFAQAGHAAPKLPPLAVKPAISAPVEFFDLADVTVLQPEFTEASARDRSFLLELDPDRLLHTFRLNVKLPSSAEPYGGWEAPNVELRGHSLGHYLSALSLMYRSTGNEDCKHRVDYIVQELARCQQASVAAGYHEGYLSAFPESFIDRVENRQSVWAPWYTLHKIMAGLLDAYQLTGNTQAREVLVKMAGWISIRVDVLPLEKMQGSLETEFGGMNEVLANLYAVTGDAEHLKLARAFNHAKIFDPLSHGEDQLDGLHANTQIPKIIGAAREYELTGEASYRTIAETFWNRVALARSFVIGGHSDREHFFPVTDFAQHLSPETAETCNTYNMLKLTRHVWSWKPDAREMDFYERALYNHILASQDPTLGMFVYLMSLEPGHFKTYSTPTNSFWCCVGTGMENHAKYGETIYAHSADALYINLFISSELKWQEKGVGLRLESPFPGGEQVKLSWSTQTPTELTLKWRHPSWADAAPSEVKINGAIVTVKRDSEGYDEIKRKWKTGDVVSFGYPFKLHSEPLPGNPNIVAVLYGPLVLSGKLGAAGMPLPYANDQLDQVRVMPTDVPTFVAQGANWLNKIERVSTNPLLFRTHGLARPNDVFLMPFAEEHNERNVVYWHLQSPTDYEKVTAEHHAVTEKWTTLLASAVDSVKPADLTSEAAHAATADKCVSGTQDGKGWRYADRGGSFEYQLSTDGKDMLNLVCAFSGYDRGRKFDILINDQKLPIQYQSPNGAEPLVVATYSIPRDALAGKDKVKIRFASGNDRSGATATVFGVALVPSGGI